MIDESYSIQWPDDEGTVTSSDARPDDAALTKIIAETISAALIREFEDDAYEGVAWRCDLDEPLVYTEPTIHTYRACAKLNPVAAAVLDALKKAGAVR